MKKNILHHLTILLNETALYQSDCIETLQMCRDIIHSYPFSTEDLQKWKYMLEARTNLHIQQKESIEKNIFPQKGDI
jgi:hypothetical protein